MKCVYVHIYVSIGHSVDVYVLQNISEPVTQIKLLKRSDLPNEVQVDSSDRILERKVRLFSPLTI